MSQFETLDRSVKLLMEQSIADPDNRLHQGESIKVLDDIQSLRKDLEELRVEHASLEDATKSKLSLQVADQSPQIANVESKYESLWQSLRDGLTQVAENADDIRSGLTDDITAIRSDLQNLKRDQVSLEKSIKDPMNALLQDVVQLRGALLTVEGHRSAPSDADLLQKRCDDDLVKLRDEHSSFIALAIEQHSDMGSKIACLESELSSLRDEVRTRVDVVNSPASPIMGSNGTGSADTPHLQLDLAHFAQRVQQQVDTIRIDFERRLTHRLQAVEQTVESLSKSGEKVKRQLGLVDEWVRPLVVDVPDLTRKLRQMDKQLHKLVGDAVKPVEDMLSQLVVGLMKTLQLLGFTSEDSSEKIGAWQEVCADLPRLMDHAWLRLRLKKGTTVLKLLRQKVDTDQVRDIHAKLDALLSCSARSSAAWHDSLQLSPSMVPVAPPRVNREDSNAALGARRPASAGASRRWAYSRQSGSDESERAATAEQ